MSRRDLRALKRKIPRGPAGRISRAGTGNPRHANRAVADPWPAPDDPAYFYLLRSRNHRDKHLVNMLLAELTQLDFRQLFICHKDAFYAQYATWSEAKKSFAADFLAEEYLVDKVGTRQELFGPEPGMQEDDDAADYGFGRNQGPWGPVPRDDEESAR